MKREWEPGDGAILRFKSGELAYGVRREDEWVHVGDFGGGSAYDDIGGFEVVCPARVSAADDLSRLVVIDLEDREQVEQLTTEYVKTWLGPRETTSPESVDQMQAALREFANPTPPKPEEPTARWARVLDGRGRVWCRTEWDGGLNKPWQHEGTHVHWQILDAVRVLSEGVTS